ncbi:MAG: hypothetical protein ACRD1U_11845 [Vicinamibacterales bacterium]
MKPRTLDELMIVNPGLPSRTRTVRLHSTGTPQIHDRTVIGCPEVRAPLYFGCDGIVYRAIRIRRPVAWRRVLVAALPFVP